MTEEKSALEVVREMYVSLPELRAAIQLLPVVGGSIDTLIEGRLSQIQARRIEHLVACLSARLSGLEKTAAKLHGEEFADLVQTTFEKAARTRSASKREHFANILARQMASPNRWEDAEAAVRLLADLDEVHG